ncbi:MAG TPA: tRNA lysidine(34) synthetase TilS [Candidatus Saccharimonadales bacterium]|nr:tRNA lysidine(34) synthetase TilS [Candidatus Saccharimonadales bacterium]
MISLAVGRYVVAVSGGVDSVVLLDMLSKQPNLELVVAHFDHGIREDSADDALFVSELAKKYKVKFETQREELGTNASEDLARTRRYKFLRSVAEKYDAELITAHHADDVIETIAINVTRGTGWRGLAVLDSNIVRPLLDMTKNEILDYAKVQNLQWHEDSTNAGDAYLRNRIRRQTNNLDDDVKRQLLALWATQKSLKQSINGEVEKLVGEGPTYSRYFFSHLDAMTGLECVRFVTEARLTRPQAAKVLHEIKTIRAHKTYQAGNGVKFDFTSRNFTVELIK